MRLQCLVVAALALPLAASLDAQSLGAHPAPRPAETHFMQGMIGHHAQAVTMTALVEERTRSRAIRLIAERIAVSQRDEIGLMQRWLRARGVEPIDPAHAEHHGGAQHVMPGMLTPAQLDTLAGARDAPFDRAFLRFMIQHHEGALVMVRELFATPGAAQDPALNRFARDVSADQRAEIARMRRELEVVARETTPHDTTPHDTPPRRPAFR
ncbi:MAG: DUF305 domain-containing protein [Gemmatimonadaceae bacterium]|nr:DUF305 domain-containing protein [Gemmatimonadaceae bacterium]